MRSIGFDHVIDYTQEDFTASERRYDLILDVKTNRPLSRYMRSLRPGGMYATVGGDTGRMIGILIFGRLFRKKKARLVMLKQNKDLPALNELFIAGSFRPVIDGHWQFDRIPEAMRYFGEGLQKGKVVITME